LVTAAKFLSVTRKHLVVTNSKAKWVIVTKKISLPQKKVVSTTKAFGHHKEKNDCHKNKKDTSNDNNNKIIIIKNCCHTPPFKKNCHQNQNV